MLLSVADTWTAQSIWDKRKRYTYTHELLHLLLLHALLKLALLVGIKSKSKYICRQHLCLLSRWQRAKVGAIEPSVYLPVHCEVGYMCIGL